MAAMPYHVLFNLLYYFQIKIMFRKIFSAILYLVILFPAVSFAEEVEPHRKSDANIIGHVVDAKTGEHLPYVSIVLKGTNIGTLTDATGHYFLKNLPEGVFQLEFSAVGYATQSKEVNLKDGITLQVEFSVYASAEALSDAVVTADRYEITKKNSSALISIMDSKLFDRASANTLSQGLVFQPGVRVETNCQNCGFQQVRINGLEGPYTQILMDSRPVFSALSGVYGLEQIPASMIERVEVLRGSGSALSGSSAIGGTINIVTKEPLRNSGQFSHSIESIGVSKAFDNNTSLNASLVTDDHKAGLFVFGQNRNRQDFDYDKDGFTEIPKLKSTTLGFRGYLKTSDYSKLTLEYHHIEEYRRGGDQLDRPPFEAQIAEEVQHSMDGGGLTFDWSSRDSRHKLSVYSSAQKVARDSYYGPGKDPYNSYGKTDGLTVMAGSKYDYHFNKCLFMPADLTAGVEYTYDSIVDDTGINSRHTDQKINIASVFLQNEWKNDHWGILLAVRGDKHSMLNKPIINPRVNIRYKPVNGLSLRASYSAGFRAPQIFDEDLHISNVGGEPSIIVTDPDLKEERSNSFSLSAEYRYATKGWEFVILGEGFYTMLDDVFALREISSEDGLMVQERYNGSGARVYGANFEGSLSYADIFQIQGGLTVQRSRYVEPEQWSQTAPAETRMFRTPDLYGYMSAIVNPTRFFSIALTGTYTGPMLVQHFAGVIPEDAAVVTRDFFDMGIKLSYDFRIYSSVVLQLNAGMKNILDAYQQDFDKGPDRDSGYIYGPSLPRTIFAGIKLSF